MHSKYKEYLSEDVEKALKTSDKHELRHRTNAFSHSVNENAERLIMVRFPQKILELTNLLRSYPFPSNELTPYEPEHKDDGRKKRKKSQVDSKDEIIRDEITNNPIQYLQGVPSNKGIVKMAEILRHEVEDLCTSTMDIKLWIQLSVPRIEDGNNFGVQVQEEIINDVARVEDHAFGMLEQVAKYYATRAKICSKIIKYPNLEDYKLSLAEFDARMTLSLRLFITDIRNDYAILYDQISKNMERIKVPRTSNAVSSMY